MRSAITRIFIGSKHLREISREGNEHGDVEDPLRTACKHAPVSVIQHVIQHVMQHKIGRSKDAPNDALRHAAYAGRPDVLAHLIRNGAPLEQHPFNSMSGELAPLDLACAHFVYGDGDLDTSLHMVRMLLDAGADANSGCCWKDRYESARALRIAADSERCAAELVRLLLDYGADARACEDEAFINAALRGCPAVLHALRARHVEEKRGQYDIPPHEEEYRASESFRDLYRYTIDRVRRAMSRDEMKPHYDCERADVESSSKMKVVLDTLYAFERSEVEQ